MSKSLKKSAIKVSNIGEYVSNSRKLNSLTFRIKPNGDAVYVQGLRKEIPVNQAKQSFPTDLKPFQRKGANPCKRAGWIFGGKSY